MISERDCFDPAARVSSRSSSSPDTRTRTCAEGPTLGSPDQRAPQSLHEAPQRPSAPAGLAVAHGVEVGQRLGGDLLGPLVGQPDT